MLQIVILAGGLATRMKPLTEKTPKAMLHVNGIPFIAHQLRLLKSQGVRRVVLCIGYLGEQIEAFVKTGSRFGLSVSYSYDGPQLQGTGGALRTALHLLDKEFLLMYGDSYLPCNVRHVGDTFQKSDTGALMIVFRNDNRWEKSNVEFRDGAVVAYAKEHRTDTMRHVDYGLLAFRKETIESLPWYFDLSAMLRHLIKENRLAGMEIRERFYEIGSHEGLRDLEKYLRGRK